MAKWNEFEELAAAISRQLAPDATIHHDLLITDQTGEPRQFDVVIEVPAPFKLLLVAIECKLYARPVAVDKVEAFVTKIRDCHINQGIMVSSKGFTRGARKKAAAHNITLLSYRQAQEADWRLLTDPSAWMSIVEEEVHEVVVRAVLDNHNAITLTALDSMYAEDGTAHARAFDSAAELIRRRLSTHAHQLGVQWAEATIRKPPDERLYIARDFFLVPIDRLYVQFNLRAFSYPVNTAFAAGHILEDVQTGSQSYKKIETLPFKPHTVIQLQEGRELTPEEYSSPTGQLFLLPAAPEGADVRLKLSITFPRQG